LANCNFNARHDWHSVYGFYVTLIIDKCVGRFGWISAIPRPILTDGVDAALQGRVNGSGATDGPCRVLKLDFDARLDDPVMIENCIKRDGCIFGNKLQQAKGRHTGSAA
jgi:hypothetical protein